MATDKELTDIDKLDILAAPIEEGVITIYGKTAKFILIVYTEDAGNIHTIETTNHNPNTMNVVIGSVLMNKLTDLTNTNTEEHHCG